MLSQFKALFGAKFRTNRGVMLVAATMCDDTLPAARCQAAAGSPTSAPAQQMLVPEAPATPPFSNAAPATPTTRPATTPTTRPATPTTRPATPPPLPPTSTPPPSARRPSPPASYKKRRAAAAADEPPRLASSDASDARCADLDGAHVAFAARIVFEPGRICYATDAGREAAADDARRGVRTVPRVARRAFDLGAPLRPAAGGGPTPVVGT